MGELGDLAGGVPGGVAGGAPGSMELLATHGLPGSVASRMTVDDCVLCALVPRRSATVRRGGVCWRGRPSVGMVVGCVMMHIGGHVVLGSVLGGRRSRWAWTDLFC